MAKNILRARQLVPVGGGMYVVTECGRVFYQTSAITTRLNEAPLRQAWIPVDMPVIEIPDPPPPPARPAPTRLESS